MSRDPQTTLYQKVYDRIVDNRILLGQDNDNSPVTESSGCVFHDLNVECQKEKCDVCE
jgi:hypothetical protein